MYYGDLLKEPLVDPRTDETFATMPKLKGHLLAYWQAQGRRRIKEQAEAKP